MCNFTKGPWIVCGVFDNENYAELTTKEGFQIATIDSVQIDVNWSEKGASHWCDDGFHIEISHEEANANAYLIAAAPDMYEMLEMIMEVHAEYYLRNEIEKLLAKARGEHV